MQMKWTRSKDEYIEYSTGYIGLRHYISVSYTSWSKHFWYIYSVNGEEVLHGNFEADCWEEAEQIVILKIRRELSFKAERWNRLLENFDKEINANENLL
jgi:hypothetical protein